MSFDAMHAGGMAEPRRVTHDCYFFTQHVSVAGDTASAADFGRTVYLPVPQVISGSGSGAPVLWPFGRPSFQLWAVAMCVTARMSATIALHRSFGLFRWSKNCKWLANHRVRLIPNATCGFSA